MGCDRGHRPRINGEKALRESWQQKVIATLPESWSVIATAFHLLQVSIHTGTRGRHPPNAHYMSPQLTSLTITHTRMRILVNFLNQFSEFFEGGSRL